MLFSSKRLEERREGLKMLEDIVNDSEKSIIIHYSCESFITNHGNTPRITSICLRHFKTAQTKSFSIHYQAQLAGKDFTNLEKSEYDELEKTMLQDFYTYTETKKQSKWVHWNMRNSNYGFEAIDNRYRILGGVPSIIDEDRRFDFPRILSKIYTYNYQDDLPSGKLLNLAAANKISMHDALKGKEEADAFDNGEYLKLHKSNLSKVDIIDAIVNLTYYNTLKVKSTTKQIYGTSMEGIIEIVQNSKILITFWSIIVFVFGFFATKLLEKYL